LGAVGASLIFGLIRGAGAFAAVLPTFVLLPRMQLAQQYRGNGHFLSAASSSRHEAMVGGALARASALRVGLGVSGAAIVSGSCVRPSHSWISRLLTSSLSLGISRLMFAGSRLAEQLSLRSHQRIVATVEDSVLRTEMTGFESQEEDAP
jgi:hypothetical protein